MDNINPIHLQPLLNLSSAITKFSDEIEITKNASPEIWSLNLEMACKLTLLLEKYEKSLVELS